MELTDRIRKGHTVWVRWPDHHPVVVRYAVAGDTLWCFGDGDEAAVPLGSDLEVTAHEIHDGAPVARFRAVAESVPGSSVDREVLLTLLEHVAMGRNLAEVEASLERHRQRPVLAIRLLEELALTG
jgi:hypothetical protein